MNLTTRARWAPFTALALVFACALLIMSGLLTGGQPAQASNPAADVKRTKCIDVGASAGVCLDVYWHRLASGGLTINNVYERVTGGFWESKAIDCSNVRMWNQDDAIRWRKDGAECDVPESPGYHVFAPSVEAPTATSLTVGWTFSPKLDAEADPGSKHISITVP